MSVTKTYAITIKFSRDDAGLVTQKGAQGEVGTVPAMTENDLECKGLAASVKKSIEGVVPVSCGVASAHIVGSVSES